MRVFRRLEKSTEHFGTLCIALLFLLMIVQVVLRYVFNYTHFLTEELGRYLLLWASLAGMALECRRGGHIRISFIIERLPANAGRLWSIFIDALILIIFLLLVYTGIGSMLFNHGQESAGMQIPLSFPFAAIPLFFIIAALFLLQRLWQARK